MLQDSWSVLLLFLIPIGGGIPGGVLLAQSKGLSWPLMAALYFISDVILACVFEPLMLSVISLGRKYIFFQKLGLILKESTRRTTAHFGTRLGPLGLILVSFGVDPMTGRAATRSAGHGFLSGWLIAITGDMFYFFLIMISTLWLNSILGDGTLTMVIILLIMVILPPAIRKVRSYFSK